MLLKVVARHPGRDAVIERWAHAFPSMASFLRDLDARLEAGSVPNGTALQVRRGGLRAALYVLEIPPLP